MYFSHGDPHPTKGKSKEQRKEELAQITRDAIAKGKEWRKEHPEGTEREMIDAADLYSAPYMMDDTKALRMMNGFIKGAGVNIEVITRDINRRKL